MSHPCHYCPNWVIPVCSSPWGHLIGNCFLLHSSTSPASIHMPVSVFTYFKPLPYLKPLQNGSFSQYKWNSTWWLKEKYDCCCSVVFKKPPSTKGNCFCEVGWLFRKLKGINSDHAPDQKKVAQLLEELKMDFAYKTLDGDKMMEMSPGELNNLLSKKHDKVGAICIQHPLYKPANLKFELASATTT